ncbi:hypothetical protein Skr01_44550 [Sphaerisporangium krabiense]|uniref:L-2-amino-thiazoline-4-carboxylic acid hydrolase n=1 Tax=Sphaerisporangium krabiense TaxID=763782 RepID=A0A7W8Z4X8_9ACTN|nr:hypothetical protein [Sphaerisporangium krabiense]MBB5627491.1 hypothetical protein [Sphaerisporangium krabiense]GII64370.1 hypothetical protein Skr01_44550 [Sphaerisporangium krabiense]
MAQYAIITMTQAERAALWQRRLFEAEAGMTRHLSREHGGQDVADWIQIRSRIFADLPEADTGDPVAWQRVFFRAQALMEQFLVSRYGHAELRLWAQAAAEVHRHVEPDGEDGALGPILRLARQAELYGSDYTLAETGSDHAALRIDHCAIWDYRERARSRGVQLTLARPCDYCTLAGTANIAAKGYTPAFELTGGDGEHGCRWEATAPRPAAPGPAAGREN